MNHACLRLVVLSVCVCNSSFGLAAEPAQDNVPPEGFEALFNVKDLEGWTEKGKPSEHWRAQDWMLVYDGKGSDLRHDRPFGDFILQLDWKVNKGGNSCVYLRGSTQVEINDGDSPAKPIWNGTTGGIYPDLPPHKRTAKPAGEWNHFEIRAEKGVITVTLNGEVTVDAGPIGFQNHGTPIYIKNLFIKSLGAVPATAPDRKQPAADKPKADSVPKPVAGNPPEVNPEDRLLPDWIWHSKTAAKDEVRYFRKIFRLDAVPTEATLSAACDSGAKVYVNGVDIGDCKNWNAPLRARVEKHLRERSRSRTLDELVSIADVTAEREILNRPYFHTRGCSHLAFRRSSGTDHGTRHRSSRFIGSATQHSKRTWLLW